MNKNAQTWGGFETKIGLARKTELHGSQGDSQPDPKCPTLVLNRKLVAQFFAGDRFFEDFYNEGIEIFIFSQILVFDFYCSIKNSPVENRNFGKTAINCA